MRTFMSYVGLILVALSLMLLGADLVTTVENHSQVTLRSFQAIWALFDAGAAKAFNAWMGQTLPSFLTTSIQTVLAIPAWSLGFVGVFIAIIFGRKHEED